MKKLKANFGCGEKYISGYINCDVLKNIKTDKRFDLNKFPYPFNKNSLDEIKMDNVLEHLDNIVKVMEELHRIIKKNGIIKIYVPYAKSDGAFQDPTHKHFFTEKSMDYFIKGYEYNYYTKIKFKLIRVELTSRTDTFSRKVRKLIPFKNFLKLFIFNMYTGITFELKAIK